MFHPISRRRVKAPASPQLRIETPRSPKRIQARTANPTKADLRGGTYIRAVGAPSASTEGDTVVFVLLPPQTTLFIEGGLHLRVKEAVIESYTDMVVGRASWLDDDKYLSSDLQHDASIPCLPFDYTIGTATAVVNSDSWPRLIAIMSSNTPIQLATANHTTGLPTPMTAVATLDYAGASLNKTANKPEAIDRLLVHLVHQWKLDVDADYSGLRGEADWPATDWNVTPTPTLFQKPNYNRALVLSWTRRSSQFQALETPTLDTATGLIIPAVPSETRAIAIPTKAWDTQGEVPMVMLTDKPL